MKKNYFISSTKLCKNAALKALLLLVTVFMLTNDAKSQVVFGYNTYPFVTSSTTGLNLLAAFKVTVTSNAIITQLGVDVGTVAGHQIRMGVHSDLAGAPSTLLALTANTVLITGQNHINLLSSINVTPGIYWIAINSNAAIPLGINIIFRF